MHFLQSILRQVQSVLDNSNTRNILLYDFPK